MIEQAWKFARVEPFDDSKWCLVVGEHAIRAGFCYRGTLDERAERINSAHEKAVAEAVQKERDRCCRIVTGWCMSDNESTVIVNAIRNPEGGSRER